MTLAELITLDKHKVRNDESLMLFYIEQFKEIFGRKPDCAGCTFSNDWKKLINTVSKNSKTRVMAVQKDTTFELNAKEKSNIFTYKQGIKPIRTYGSKMTEEFAEKLLSTGTKEQIEKNKKAFKVLPEKFRKESDDEGEGDNGSKAEFDKAYEAGDLNAEQLETISITDIKEYAKKHNYKFGSRSSKDDLVKEVAAKEVQE